MGHSHTVGGGSFATGLDALLGGEESGMLARLKGARVGLLVNPTSVTRDYEHAIEAFGRAGVKIVRLFGPEHGVRSEAQDMEAVDGSIDPISGIDTVSLYGHTLESLEPREGDLDGLDVVVCDIQDVGARYYTYAYTVGLMMKACGAAGVECWVLDRPNPLGGEVLEGNVVLPECASFVGLQPLATRHGMTLGELARFFAAHGGWGCDLEVVAMRGWSRGQWFDQTTAPWVMPSPNMPTLDTATVYPGQCLLEGTNLSEARGTTRPFELFGAPYVDAVALKARLDAFELPGVVFRLASFRPMFQKHANQTCQGLQMHVTDRDAFRSVLVSTCVISACLELFPNGFGWRDEAYEFVEDVPAIDLLFGDAQAREKLERGDDPREIFEWLEGRRGAFEERRAGCLMYE